MIGTVDTLAGPGYCDAPTIQDPSSLAVGAVAVAPDGSLYFDTGAAARGIVAIARPDGATTVASDLPVVGPDAFGPGAAEQATAPSASRLVVTPALGAVLAAAHSIVPLQANATPIAGDSSNRSPAGASGDGGPATAARFTLIRSIASDADGNLYVADAIDPAQSTFRVRFLNRTGQPVTFYAGTAGQMVVRPGDIDTVAGDASGSTAVGDERVAAKGAALRGVPPAMAVRGRVLYVASADPSPGNRARVQALNLGGADVDVLGVGLGPGRIETVAGGGQVGFSGDGGDARAANVGYLPGIAADDANLYLADEQHQRVRKVDQRGVISTVVGTGGSAPTDGGFNGNGRAGVDTRLDQPYDVKLGPSGLYISDRGNGQIRVLDSSGTVRAAAGAGVARSWDCARAPASGVGGADRVRQGGPLAVSADIDGDLYFVGAYLPDIKRVSNGGEGLVTSVAGQRQSEVCPAAPAPCPVRDGPAGLARFDHPTAVVARKGGVYVYDGGNRRVRFVNTSTTPITLHGVTVAAGAVGTVAGNGSAGSAGDGGPALAAQLSSEGALSLTPDGGLVVVDIGNHRVRQVDNAGQISSVLSGGDADHCCAEPVAVAADRTGNLYLVDRASDRVWFLNRTAGDVEVQGHVVAAGTSQPVAGSGTAGVPSEGVPALDSQLLHPAAVAVDTNGNLYIADDKDHSVLRVDPTGQLTTIVGTGNFGFSGDGRPGPLTELDEPSGLAIDHCGNLLIADRTNDRVRRLNLTAPCSPLAAAGHGKGWPVLELVAAAALVLFLASASVWIGRRGSRHPGVRSPGA